MPNDPLEPDEIMSAKSKGTRFETVSSPEIVHAPMSGSLSAFAAAHGSQRFQVRSAIGKGGMGEIALVFDRQIGRNVAVKSVRSDRRSEEVTRRFLREARIQGQLEHPSIVPVYDLQVDENGAPKLTMKRVDGHTLEEVLEGLRARDPRIEKEFSIKRVLEHFHRACRAIEFAHARGVIHRDLKPGNIMFGSFAEVYVLDWGVAKVGDADDSVEIQVTGENFANTGEGSVLGTLGYMSPEQLIGDPVDERADVYALGAILFEILCLEALHPSTNMVALSNSVHSDVEARPSARETDRPIPPELDALCVDACQRNLDRRVDSVRTFSERLAGYLEGDRNLQLRKETAERLLLQSREAFVAARNGGDELSLRMQAMQSLGQSLALDPRNPEALRAFADLLTTPPKQIPPEADFVIAEAERRLSKTASVAARFAYGSWFLYIPLMWAMGIRQWPLFILISALMLISSVASYANMLGDRQGSRLPFMALFANLVATSLLSRLFGPYFFMPMLSLGALLAFSLNHLQSSARLAGVLAVLAFVVPVGLEWAGIIPSNLHFENGSIVISPQLISFDHPQLVSLLLTLANGGLLVTLSLYTLWIKRRMKEDARNTALRDWQLDQFVPALSRTTLTPRR